MTILLKRKQKTVGKKRSTLKNPVREDRPPAVRRSQEVEAEGGFGTGAVKREVAAFAWSALEDLRDMWCGADLQMCMCAGMQDII